MRKIVDTILPTTRNLRYRPSPDAERATLEFETPAVNRFDRSRSTVTADSGRAPTTHR